MQRIILQESRLLFLRLFISLPVLSLFLLSFSLLSFFSFFFLFPLPLLPLDISPSTNHSSDFSSRARFKTLFNFSQLRRRRLMFHAKQSFFLSPLFSFFLSFFLSFLLSFFLSPSFFFFFLIPLLRVLLFHLF